MKKIQILLCLCLFLNGRNQAQSLKTTFNIQVKSEKVQEVTLSKYDYESEKMIEVKTLRGLSTNGAYQIADQIPEPSIYAVNLNTGKEIKIAVEQNGPIHLVLDDEITLASNVATKSDFGQTILILNGQFFGDLISEFDETIKENDQATIALLEQRKDEILVKFIAAMENTVREMGPSALAYDALPYFDSHKNFDFLTEMTERFKVKYPNSRMTKSLQARMAKIAKTAIGQVAPLFKAKDLEGATINLEDYRGSFVLIDFWASWCRACRIENPKFVAFHEEYKDKKFEIISISIDSDIASWKNAIEQDGLAWRQILDTDKSIFSLYLLSSLPSNFLLNQEGEIIAKNIHADQLSVLLSENIQSKGN